MGCTFDYRKAHIEHRAEERCAHLANSTAHAFDRTPAINDKCFCKTIIQAYISHGRAHRKCFPRGNEYTMKALRCGLDVLSPFLTRTKEVRGLCMDQFSN